MRKRIRAEDIGQLELGLAPERQVGRHGSCSVKYVRGREAREAGADPIIGSGRMPVPSQFALGMIDGSNGFESGAEGLEGE